MSALFPFKCLAEKQNEKSQRSSSSQAEVQVPIIGLVNGLSGGHKGDKVRAILQKQHIPTFDLLKLSTDDSYFTSFIEQFTEMYDSIMKQEEQYTKQQHADTFELHPRIFIGGGDGSIAWALSMLDRALLDNRLLHLFWRRSQNLNPQNNDARDSKLELIDTTAFKESIKRKLSVETTVSNDFYYSQACDSDTETALNASTDAYDFITNCGAEDSQYSSSASLSAANEEEIIEQFMNQKLSLHNSPDIKRRTEDDDEADDTSLSEEKDDALSESLVTHEELQNVRQQKASAALFNNQQSNQELRILQGVYDCRISPTIALIPLGTGNDLSRCLGTGFVYPGSKELTHHLISEYKKAPIAKLDRWKIAFLDTHQALKPRQTSELLCYFSIGFEGQIAYKFQCARSKNPKLFDRPWRNKMQYILSGIGAGVEEALRITKPLNNVIECWVDGERLKLPSNTRSLVISNIQSMADGVYFWGKGPNTRKDMKEYNDPQLGDAKLEVMAAKGIYKYLQMKVGLSHYRRLAQPRKVTIIMKQELPIQVDGESWIESKGIIQIYLLHQVFAVVGKNEPRGVQIL